MSFFTSSVNEKEEFTVHHVYDIRSACVCLLDSIATLVETRQNENPASYQMMAKKMFSLDANIFQGIHQRYLWWASSVPTKGKLSRHVPRKQAPNWRSQSADKSLSLRDIDSVLDKLLFSLTTALDSCKSTFLQCLKRRSDREMMLHEQLKHSQSKLSKMTGELALAQSKLESTSREREMWFQRLDDIKVQLQESERRIIELERNADVLSWQTQIDNIVKKHNSKEEEMKEVLLSSKEGHKQSYTNLQTRISKLQENIARLKIKTEFTMIPTTNSLLEKLEYKKRETYLKDQEIYLLQKQINEHHRLMIGCINGLDTDYRKLMEKCNIENPSGKFSPDGEKVKYQAMLRYIRDSCLQGSLYEIQGNLPDHYSPPEKLPKGFRQRKLLMKTTTNQKVTKSLTNKLPVESVSKLRSNSLNIGASTQNKHLPDVLVIRPHSAESKVKSSPREASTVITNKKTKPHSHPILVNTITGRANLSQVMKHFPYLTVEQVSKQWEHFKSYDKNGDFRLDLPELYEVVQDVLGIKVSIQDMREAMKEVDRDNSNNIDFFEYLKISEMIMKKQGKSALFKDGLSQENGLISSQVCAVQ
uniref:Uncharacterized protein LOC100178721 n=1 Tax=Phallusia mammillata TaxID=59560 RepID=A0A6F9DHJ9_9ASCI|nr:uncharacterized protein LOC100178721 [Phallusia mammillata]